MGDEESLGQRREVQGVRLERRGRILFYGTTYVSTVLLRIHHTILIEGSIPIGQITRLILLKRQIQERFPHKPAPNIVYRSGKFFALELLLYLGEGALD